MAPQHPLLACVHPAQILHAPLLSPLSTRCWPVFTPLKYYVTSFGPVGEPEEGPEKMVAAMMWVRAG